MRDRADIENDRDNAVEQTSFEATAEVLDVLKLEVLLDIRDLLMTIHITT